MKYAAIVALFSITLASCTGADPRSVEWFMEHEGERKVVLADCSQNAIPDSVECLNAQKAEDSLALKRRGYVRPGPVDFGEE